MLPGYPIKKGLSLALAEPVRHDRSLVSKDERQALAVPPWLAAFRPAPAHGTYALRLRCASRLRRPLVRPVTGAPVAPYFVPVSRHPMRAPRPFSSALLGRESCDQPLRSLTADEPLLWKRRCVRTLSSSSHVRESIPQPTLPVGKSRRLHHEKGRAPWFPAWPTRESASEGAARRFFLKNGMAGTEFRDMRAPFPLPALFRLIGFA